MVGTNETCFALLACFVHDVQLYTLSISVEKFDLMQQGCECKLYIGPGSYHCALDIAKDDQLNADRVNKKSGMLKFEKWIIFIQSASFEHILENGTDFLYCEHKWV